MFVPLLLRGARGGRDALHGAVEIFPPLLRLALAVFLENRELAAVDAEPGEIKIVPALQIVEMAPADAVDQLFPLERVGGGRLGKTEWIVRYLRISREHIDKATRFLAGKGALMACFVALPYIGDAIAVVLGLMRSNVWVTTLSMFLGKLLRYVALLYAAEGLISLF